MAGVVDELTGQISGLDERLQQLEQRLSPVLGPDHPSPQSSTRDEPAISSDLANQVHRLRNLNDRLDRLMTRIEV